MILVSHALKVLFIFLKSDEESVSLKSQPEVKHGLFPYIFSL